MAPKLDTRFTVYSESFNEAPTLAPAFAGSFDCCTYLNERDAQFYAPL